MRKGLDSSLAELKELLIELAAGAKAALTGAMETLVNGDEERANRIVKSDAELNRKEERIIEISARLILTQQPVAKDLRIILAAIKIASDLERMGDLAIDVAKAAIRLNGQPLIKPLLDLQEMADIVADMIEDSIRAFVEENVDLACKMAKDDDRVDEMFSRVFMDLTAMMAENPQQISLCMVLALVARYIERIADHATNIGESVVYLVTNKRPELN